jgi:4-oxalmesaconate hydratase
VGADSVVFASEMIGAVKGVDPRSGHYYDDTKRYLDAIEWLSEADKAKIFEGNALRAYLRLAGRLEQVGLA